MMRWDEYPPEEVFDGFYNKELRCLLMGVLVTSPTSLHLVLAQESCTDMTGAISLAKKILPKVERILAGDTLYALTAKGWQALDHPRKEYWVEVK